MFMNRRRQKKKQRRKKFENNMKATLHFREYVIF
jgi:hypothetical protein